VALVRLGLSESPNLDNLVQKIEMKGTFRKNIRPGLAVRIVMKEDQRSGELTEGYVKDILTNAPQHPHGIKVRLDTGEVGRVKEVIEEE
jgi:uncharacterized repeat protein (TIGR03833 family)